MDRSKAMAGLLVAVFVLTSPDVTSAAGHKRLSQSGSGSNCWRFKETERSFARKINADRSLKALGNLGLDRELSKAARVHTWAMARRNELYHTPSDTLRRRITNWTILGENVGVGSSVDSLHDAFMNSPAHKANILYNTFRYVGVGVLQKDGRMWVTVIFAAGKDPGTTLPMPPC